MIFDKRRPQESKSIGISITLLIFTFLSFIQWEPPGFYIFLESFRWYFMIVVVVIVFIFQTEHMKISSSQFYILFSILFWFGALLSLFRTPDPDQVLYNIVSMGISFFLGLVFIPVISLKKGRLIWWSTLLTAALFWAFKIIRLWFQNGENIRYILHGPGLDHNLIGLLFSMAATGLMIIALYGNFVIPKVNPKIINVISLISSFGLLICSFLTYSRSGFIVTVLGIIFAIFTLILSNKKQRIFTLLIILLILIFTITISISEVQGNNPIWFIKFNEIFNLDDSYTSIFVRTTLLRKAWGFIQDDPIIGIGPEIFRTIYDPLIGHQSYYMVHNTYLKAWVENGILGLAGIVIWVLLWVRLFLTKWNDFDVLKRALISTFAPFFLMFTFLDVGGFPQSFMLIIFSSLYNERDIVSNSFAESKNKIYNVKPPFFAQGESGKSSVD
ncbi:MAG: O-antigen ligase family protein [Chloroflexi bacterium]|nr:O-antigen ligase family protein [Chloroflexota bacterium]